MRRAARIWIAQLRIFEDRQCCLLGSVKRGVAATLRPLAAMASTKSPRRRTYHHGDLKAALVRSSLDLIDRHGVHGFTMSDAAKAAGVTVAAPYRHFADREALIATVAALGFSMLVAELEAAAAASKPGAAMMEMAVAYVEFGRTHRAHFRAMFEAGIAKSRYPDLEIAADRAYATLSAATLQLAGKRASAAKRATVTAALWSTVHGFAVLAPDAAFSELERGLPPGELLRGVLSQVLQLNVK